MRIFLIRCVTIVSIFLHGEGYTLLGVLFIVKIVVQLKVEEEICQEAEARVKELEKQVIFIY